MRKRWRIIKNGAAPLRSRRKSGANGTSAGSERRTDAFTVTSIPKSTESVCRRGRFPALTRRSDAISATFLFSIVTGDRGSAGRGLCCCWMRQGGRTSPSSMTTSRRTIRRSGSSGAAAFVETWRNDDFHHAGKASRKVPLRADGARPSLTADGRTEPAKRGGFLKRKPPLLQPMEKIASGIQQVCIRPFEEPRRRGRAAL